MIKTKKRVGNNISLVNDKWSFSHNKIAKNFENHITQSIPYYKEGHNLILKLSEYFLPGSSATVCYDFGSSTGCLTHKLASYHRSKRHITWIGIDKELSMIKFAKTKYHNAVNIKFNCANVLNFPIKNNTNFIVCYYLLQFMSFDEKIMLIKKIYTYLKTGGGVIIFDKVFANSASFQDMFHTIHMNYKKENNLSTTEIYNKTESLKGVLSLNTSIENQKMLSKAGFKRQHIVMKHLNFEGYLAVK